MLLANNCNQLARDTLTPRSLSTLPVPPSLRTSSLVLADFVVTVERGMVSWLRSYTGQDADGRS
jgi:hypothetical protein